MPSTDRKLELQPKDIDVSSVSQPAVRSNGLTAPRKQVIAMQQVHCYGIKCVKVKQQKEKLVNTSSSQKSLCGLKLDYFRELKWETVEFVHLKGN